MPHASIGYLILSALGGAGTLSCAAMVLLEIAFPQRISFVTKKSEGGGGSRSGSIRCGLLELYMATVTFMPAAALAQVWSENFR